MRKTVFAFLFLLGLAGCATPIDQEHIAHMNSYIGKTDSDLIVAWGTPDKTYKSDSGAKILTWRRGQQVVTGGGFSTCTGTAGGGTLFTQCMNPFPPEATTYYCEFSFNITGGRVKGWFENGNNCPRVK